MLRIWLTSVGIGVIYAWYAGLDPFSPYLYEWIILGCIAFAAGILLLIEPERRGSVQRTKLNHGEYAFCFEA